MIPTWQLERWLAREVLGQDIGRKPPQKARRASPARDRKYRAWIRSLPSAVSGKGPCEACHTGSDGGASMKASDYSCIPLIPEEHREYHWIGKPAFEQKYRLDCEGLVRRLNREWKLMQRSAA